MPEDAGLSVDEKFARLVAEIGDGGAVRQAPAPKEEAARTRELRSKWSVDPPKAVGWRTDGPSTLPAYPSTEAPGEAPRKRRVGRKLIPVVGVVAAVAIVYGYINSTSTSTATPVNATPAGTEQPWAQPSSASPSPSASYANPDDAYFAGTPALGWKDNEAGFSVPKAAEIHGVDSDDVTTGYKLLEKLMEAGNLDATILDGGSTADFSRLLDPKSQASRQLPQWIAHPAYDGDPTLLVSRFNPATTRLLGHTVKVNGSMSASAGPQQGTAYLTANYLFAYAVGPADGDRDAASRVTVHRSIQIEIFNGNEYRADPDHAFITDMSSYVSNITCYRYDGYIDPGFDGRGAAPNISGVANPYATGNLLTASAEPSPTSTEGECQAASGY